MLKNEVLYWNLSSQVGGTDTHRQTHKLIFLHCGEQFWSVFMLLCSAKRFVLDSWMYTCNMYMWNNVCICIIVSQETQSHQQMLVDWFYWQSLCRNQDWYVWISCTQIIFPSSHIHVMYSWITLQSLISASQLLNSVDVRMRVKRVMLWLDLLVGLSIHPQNREPNYM